MVMARGIAPFFQVRLPEERDSVPRGFIPATAHKKKPRQGARLSAIERVEEPEWLTLASGYEFGMTVDPETHECGPAVALLRPPSSTTDRRA
jgi:hypothetical protein